MDRTISTRFLPESDRFDFWRDEVTKQHLLYDIEQLNSDKPFHAKMQGAVLGDIIFGMACLSGVKGTRTAQHIAVDSLDHYVVGIPIKQSIIMQDGVEYALAENEMVLFDGTRPLTYQHNDHGGGITIAIPRYCLEDRLAVAERKGLRIASLQEGVGLMVHSFCRTLPHVMESHPSAAVRQGLAEQLTALIALAFQASDEGKDRAKPIVSELRLQAVKDFIAANLHDASLSPGHLVQALGLSRSYLYKLFAQHHFSFQDYLRRQRLTRVAMDLRNPSLNGVSITDIAISRGFNSISHFSRCFKTQFNESPRAYRARMGCSDPGCR